MWGVCQSFACCLAENRTAEHGLTTCNASVTESPKDAETEEITKGTDTRNRRRAMWLTMSPSTPHKTACSLKNSCGKCVFTCAVSRRMCIMAMMCVGPVNTTCLAMIAVAMSSRSPGKGTGTPFAVRAAYPTSWGAQRRCREVTARPHQNMCHHISNSTLAPGARKRGSVRLKAWRRGDAPGSSAATMSAIARASSRPFSEDGPQCATAQPLGAVRLELIRAVHPPATPNSRHLPGFPIRACPPSITSELAQRLLPPVATPSNPPSAPLAPSAIVASISAADRQRKFLPTPSGAASQPNDRRHRTRRHYGDGKITPRGSGQLRPCLCGCVSRPNSRPRSETSVSKCVVLRIGVPWARISTSACSASGNKPPCCRTCLSHKIGRALHEHHVS